jgi:endogenous inhibitor of DNA gyrase (YacG/DUF329 family)
MLFRKHIAKITCPCCFQPVPWQHRSRFTGLFGKRKPVPCPSCGASIIWDKWAHGLLIGGGLTTGALFIFGATVQVRIISQGTFNLILLTAAIMVVLGYFRLRFVPYERCPKSSADFSKTS